MRGKGAGNMIRFILYLVIGYAVWRAVMFIFRAMTKPVGQSGDGQRQRTAAKNKQEQMEFKDVRDAEYVDVSEKEPHQK